MLLGLVKRSNLAFNIVRHFFCSGMRWPYVEWANAQFNFVCIIHGLEGGWGGGADLAFPLLFHENLASRTFFIALPNPVFFLSNWNTQVKTFQLLQKRISVRCRLALLIDILNYILVWWSGGKTGEEEAKRERGGEGMVSSHSLSQSCLPRFSFLLTFLWAFKRLEPSSVAARI